MKTNRTILAMVALATLLLMSCDVCGQCVNGVCCIQRRAQAVPQYAPEPAGASQSVPVHAATSETYRTVRTRRATSCASTGCSRASGKGPVRRVLGWVFGR